MRIAVALLFVLAAGVVVPGASAREPRDPSWQYDWAQRHVRMPDVWDHTTGSPAVVIAAVDTGVNRSIADLGGALLPGWDFVDGDGVPEDTHGHGTLTASLMAARGDNRLAIAGYCWQCRILPVRVGSSQETDDRTIATGIRWAVDQGARIVNVGFVQETGSPPDSTVGAAVRYAASKDVLVVASAGNTGGSAPTYPGAYPEVLAVAATEVTNSLYPWSTRGSWVDLAAPGCQYVISIVGTWGELCGSSFTAPVVAAVAGLALSVKPALSAAELRRAFVETAVPVAGIGGGRLDAFAALQRLGAIGPPAPPPPPPPPVSPPPPSANSPQTGGGASKAKPALAKVSRAGTLRRSLRVRVSLGAGKLTVKLTSRFASQCELAVAAGPELMLARRRGTTLQLSRKVVAGRHLVEVQCRTKKAKRYRLSVVGTRAPRPTPPGVSG